MFFNTASVALGALATIGTGLAFFPGSSQAACVSSSPGNNCAIFTVSSASPATFDGFSDLGFAANPLISEISFLVSGYTSPTPFHFTSVEYSFTGAPASFVSLGTATVAIPPGSTGNLLGGPIAAPGGVVGTDFTVKATLPAGVDPLSFGNFLEVKVVSNNGTGTLPQSQTRLSVAVPDIQVPGPLPILGAATAFGYSRKIRSKIKQVA